MVDGGLTEKVGREKVRHQFNIFFESQYFLFLSLLNPSVMQEFCHKFEKFNTTQNGYRICEVYVHKFMYSNGNMRDVCMHSEIMYTASHIPNYYPGM